MRFIPQHEVVHKYGAILPDNLTTQAMKEFEAYKTYYAFATRKAILKPKYVARLGKKKKPAKGLETLSEIALSEAEQMKLAIERSKTRIHNSQPSGLGTHEGTGVKPRVPDVPTYEYDDEKISWKSSDEEDYDVVVMSDDADDNDDQNDDDTDNEDDDNQNDDNADNESDDDQNDDDDLVHPKLSTFEKKKDKMMKIKKKSGLMMKHMITKIKVRMLREKNWMKRM
ncbi:hypothetical protein Tco_1305686, partial [Tanacetum coccineum]